MKASHLAGLPLRLYVVIRRDNSAAVRPAAALAALALTLASCARQEPTAPSIEAPHKPGVVAKSEPEPPRPRFPKPEAVRGIYLTAWSAGSKRKMDKVIPMLKRTELNALVIDVRDDGLNYFKNDIPESAAIKASRTAVVNPQALMERLEKEGIYPIARIACFRDEVAPRAMPGRAVMDVRTGKPWQDRSKHTWLDPYNEKNWQYIAAVVDHALDLGFPEIQLDYVRFPSEGKASTMAFPARKDYSDPDAGPTDVVAAFGKYIAERVHAKGAVLSADIFGIVSSGGGDQGIGQELMKVVEPFDLICPMVYPSHFAKGEYGIKDPNSSPYAIVLKSLKDYAEKVPEKKVRPWLQDFSLGVKYGVKEVQAQIKAAREAGYNEYLLWNAQNQYTEAAVKDTSKLVKKPDNSRGTN